MELRQFSASTVPMTSPHFSSGDLIADRRADYARMFAESGEFAEAAELMEQALEQVPSWAAGWFRLAEYADKAGQTAMATAALEKVVALDPTDIFGAGLKLAVLGAAATPAAPPTPYVERLFDDYADRFDTALVKKLDYTVPQTLARLVRRHASEAARFGLVSDIGCGTGLGTKIIGAMAISLGTKLDYAVRVLGTRAELTVRMADAARPL